MTRATPDSPKEVRGGRFVLVRELGGGAQAATWEAVDKQVGQAVVVKVFRVRGAPSWKAVELAEREAKVLQSVHHELCPKYVDHFEEDGCLYLAMTRIQGTPLDVIAKSRGFDAGDVHAFLHDAADVLEYLHGRHPPLVHRDVKPSNVLRREDGRYCLVDFGSVRDSLKPEGGSTVVGTFGYMAPEQFQGRAMPASDLYAVGATALFMLTGRDPDELPHVGLRIDVARALSGDPPSPQARVIERLVEPDPDRRARSLRQLLELHRIDRDGPRRVGRPPQPSGRRRPPSEPERPHPTGLSMPHRRRRSKRRSPPEHLLLVILLLGLTVAQLAVFVVLRRVAPFVLRTLARVVHPELRSAARHVSEIGSEIIDELAAAKSTMVNEAARDGRKAAQGARETTREHGAEPASPDSSRKRRAETPRDVGNIDEVDRADEVDPSDEPRHDETDDVKRTL